MNEGKSYASILRSSSIIGGAQAINMLVALVRTKIVAVLLGPGGIGLVGIYLSITALANTLAGMGIRTSGVRDISKHHGDKNATEIATTVTTLRRVCWLTGITGTLMLTVGAPWISQVSFGSDKHTLPIAFLGVSLLFNNLNGGQSAVLRGTRRIADLARAQVIGGILGTIASIAIYAWLGIAGIVPALIVLSIATLAVSTYYSRKLPLIEVEVPWKQSLAHAGSLLKFGASMVVAGLAGALATYAIRAILTNELNLQAVGIYTAAFALSGMFVQFVLQAMGADFYPRLTAVSDDHMAMRRLINEQTEIGLFLAFPGLLATLAMAPWVITLFYTAEFSPAADMLKWLVLGCMGQVLSWPMGFCLLAKGQGKTFATTETIFHSIHVAMVLALMKPIGLTGAAVAYAVLYGVCTISMLIITKVLIDFRWSRGVLTQLAWMAPLAAAVFTLDVLLDRLLAGAIGSVATFAAGIACLRQLTFRLGSDHSLSRCLKKLPCGHLFVLSSTTTGRPA